MLSEQDVKPAPVGLRLQANTTVLELSQKNSFNCTKRRQTVLKLKCCVLYFVIQITGIQSAFISIMCLTEVL